MTRTRSTFLSLIVVLLAPMAANAVLIETSAGTYDVTTVEGGFDALASTLMAQVWWGDSILADEFADLTSGLLGISALNTSNFGQDAGALFAVCTDECLFSNESFPLQGKVYAYAGSFVNNYGTDGRIHEYAIARRVAVPEPGTLALLSLGLLGMGISRRKKKV